MSALEKHLERNFRINIPRAITPSSPILVDETQCTDNKIITTKDNVIVATAQNETVNTEDAQASFIADTRQRFFRKSLTYPLNLPNQMKRVGGIQLNSELFSQLPPVLWLDGE